MNCRRSRPSATSCLERSLSPTQPDTLLLRWALGRRRWQPRSSWRSGRCCGCARWCHRVRPKRRNAQPPPPPAQPRDAAASSAPAPPVATGPSLEQLARFEPPRYEPLRLRGVPDEATARFQRGMEHYRKADYAAAVDDLRAAADTGSRCGPHPLFSRRRPISCWDKTTPRSTGFGPRLRSATRPISKRRTFTWRRRFCGGRISAPPKRS